jgi:hypothetical protein
MPPHGFIMTLLVALMMTGAAADGSLELVLVQVIHRHGARSPITPVNASTICPRGCGVLNYQGKDMLLKQGDYLQARYNGSRPELYNGAQPYFASELYPEGTTYDVRYTYSRSTDLTRTLQSASGLLKGLFPNASEYYPAINTVAFLQDELLLIDVSPSYHIYQQLNTPVLFARLKAFLNTQFPPGIIHNISVELGVEGYCSHDDTLIPCVLAMQDIAASRNAEGRLEAFPTTSLYYTQLNNCRRTWNSYYFPFNLSNPVDAARGSLGQNIVQRMLQNMQSALEAASATDKKDTFPYKLMHYSAHDTTVMPFCATLGNPDMMLPLFGQLYTLDLLRNATDGTFHVRAAQSVPGQTPASHQVEESVFPLHCMDASNATYTVRDLTATCPLDDFRRFINSTLPTAEAGSCYLSPDAVQAIGCNVVGGDGPLPNSTCYFYRSYCPTFACPLGTVLSPATYACVVLSTTSIEGSVSSGVVAATTVGAAFAAFFLGVFSKNLWDRRRLKNLGKYSAVAQ